MALIGTSNSVRLALGVMLLSWTPGRAQVAMPYVGETVEHFNSRSGDSSLAGSGVARPFLGETTQEYRARERGEPAPDDTIVTVPADANGHFLLECSVNGSPLQMIVDTGATLVSLPYEAAKGIGVDVSKLTFNHPIQTASGRLDAASVRLDRIEVGSIEVRGVDAVVLPPGSSDLSLLGMTFLKRLSRFEIAGGKLILHG